MKSLITSKEVFWVIAFKIHPGKEEQFKALSARLIESTQNEAGALNYEWSLSEDGGICHIYERYTDSAAVKIHLQRNGELVKQLLTTSALHSFVLYGSPDEETRKILSTRNAIPMIPLGGFGR